MARDGDAAAGSCTCSSRTTGAPARPWTSRATALNGATKEEITQIVNKNELWFLPVANPDGYDYTFTPDNRLWRKNLRDNNGDGQITPDQDGVDPNRNFPTNWNYDNEGSSSEFASETYRGPGPGSEPETKAFQKLLDRVGFEMNVNYHTAAELLLYPIGFQVETYTADDPIYRALSGTDADSAIKGNGEGAPDNYDPDVGAELYTTNGDTNDHLHKSSDTLSWTPELDVGDAARGGGGSVFEFQDRADDVRAVFEKNIPFALDVAKSAADPANPVSHLGNTPENFVVSSFETSYGDPQDVQVNAKRELGKITMHYRVNGGAEQTAPTKEWNGGERYGGGYNLYYHRLRGNGEGDQAGRQGPRVVRGRRQAVAVLHLRAGAGDQQPRADHGLGGLHRPQPGLRQQDRPELPELLPAGAAGQRDRLRRLGHGRPRPHRA